MHIMLCGFTSKNAPGIANLKLNRTAENILLPTQFSTTELELVGPHFDSL